MCARNSQQEHPRVRSGRCPKFIADRTASRPHPHAARRCPSPDAPLLCAAAAVAIFLASGALVRVRGAAAPTTSSIPPAMGSASPAPPARPRPATSRSSAPAELRRRHTRACLSSGAVLLRLKPTGRNFDCHPCLRATRPHAPPPSANSLHLLRAPKGAGRFVDAPSLHDSGTCRTQPDTLASASRTSRRQILLAAPIRPAARLRARSKCRHNASSRRGI